LWPTPAWFRKPAANYRRAGIRRFVLAYCARNPGEVRGLPEALGFLGWL
jgi:hypothetical protein